MCYDLIGIGSAVYDTLLFTHGFPAEDEKIRADAILNQGGGPCSTALCAAAKLGARAAFIGAVGDDTAGHAISDDLTHWGVDTTHLLHRAGQTSTQSFVLVNQPRATRTCVACGGDAAPLSPDELPMELIRRAKVLHLDGRTLEAAIAGAQIAHETGVTVSYDAGRVYPGIDALLPLTDWLIASETFVTEFTGESDPEKAALRLWREYRPEVLIVTQGARGGFRCEGSGITRYPAFPVEAVDSNGAGDVFHGAYIAACLRGMPSSDAQRFASAASAIKCRGAGARIHAPTWDAVQDFLRSRK